MIVLDDGDAIRGIAEVIEKLDFTVNGYVGTTATQLADGQMHNGEADLYASGADATIVTSITVVNTDSAARTFTLYLKPSGGTSRAITPVSLDLGIGHSLYTDGQRITVLDTSGQILSTWAVDDIPIDGETAQPISSNWAYDHDAATTGIHGAGSDHLALFGAASTVVNRVVWNDVPTRALADVNRTATLAWTDLDLTASTSANAGFALLTIIVLLIGWTDGFVKLSVRKNDTTPDRFPVAFADNQACSALINSTNCIVALGSGQVMEYELKITGTAEANFYVDVLGYVE